MQGSARQCKESYDTGSGSMVPLTRALLPARTRIDGLIRPKFLIFVFGHLVTCLWAPKKSVASYCRAERWTYIPTGRNQRTSIYIHVYRWKKPTDTFIPRQETTGHILRTDGRSRRAKERRAGCSRQTNRESIFVAFVVGQE